MLEPRLRHVTCASPKGLHRLAYWEWLPAAAAPGGAPVVVCVHGLTRNGRDFDALAARLSTRWRVVCPDMVGRGRSDRVADPQLYALPQYIADCVTLAARLDVERVAWVGTSMGGLIGMLLAAIPGTPIGRLVLNDIGPEVDAAGRARIGGYVGQDPQFATEAEGVAALRELMRDFGPHTDDQFRLLTRNYLVPRGDGFTFAYDPAIAEAFRQQQAGPAPDLWPFYDAIRCPTLVTRGAQSDILSAATAEAMTQRGPKARCVAFAGVGHAPTFIAADQVDAVERFLSEELQ
ncbi:MAG: alpha/beta hydrolase [Burkholderiaceae bacterium]|nr:alpha/beta hydrolase [Burkholderiaceae bacterium]